MKNTLKSVLNATAKAVCVIVLSSGSFQAMNTIVLNSASTAHAEGPNFCPRGC